MDDAKQQNVGSDDLEELCRHCGKSLSNFLHEMEEHNAEVVCPACGKQHEVSDSRSGQGGKMKAPAREPKN